ncbi:MAG: hypothetical protein JNM57_14480 [Cyclobacteriaceae bacterium]|nr:hypothetical protein [Cyclobacteriaceae bacterium]
MKRLILPMIVLLLVSTTFVSAQEIPSSEFTIKLSESELILKPGDTRKVTVSILRSKSYRKSEAVLGLSSGLPEGVTVRYEPASGLIESSEATIAIAEQTKPGTYMIILKGTLSYKSKGATLKLVVKEGAAEAVSSLN